jgi:NAD kinase
MRIKYIPTEDIRGKGVNKLVKDNFPRLISEEHPELILVTGGDGSLLHAIQSYNYLQIPFFGHASGTLNFLMNKAENLKEVIKSLLENETKLDYLETTSIRVVFKNKHSEKFIGHAVNEVILGTHIMGYHDFILSSGDNSFDGFEIKGSGISVCTDLGSTGYNFGLGGSVLPIGSNLWSVNGIVCNRFLEDIINMQTLEIKLSDTSRPADLFLDGVKKEINLDKDSSVILSKGEVIKIAFLDKENFFKRRLEIISRYRK